MYLTWMMYPNPNTPQGIELKLRQEYFFVSASIQEIAANFQNNVDFRAVPRQGCHPHQRHPASPVHHRAAPTFCGRLEHQFGAAWDLVKATFAFTNHSVLSNAVEKWDTDMLGRVLPRHLELIYHVNYIWLESVKKQDGMTGQKLAALSLVEEQPKKCIRMAALCIWAPTPSTASPPSTLSSSRPLSSSRTPADADQVHQHHQRLLRPPLGMRRQPVPQEVL